jgi:hypothetical protein
MNVTAVQISTRTADTKLSGENNKANLYYLCASAITYLYSGYVKDRVAYGHYYLCTVAPMSIISYSMSCKHLHAKVVR